MGTIKEDINSLIKDRPGTITTLAIVWFALGWFAHVYLG